MDPPVPENSVGTGKPEDDGDGASPILLMEQRKREARNERQNIKEGRTMAIETVRNVFAWCLVINFALIILWLILFVLAHEWIYRVHNRMFKVSSDAFYAINYGGIGLYKMIIFVFIFIPYIAMHIVYR